jgi:hypothetical protein
VFAIEGDAMHSGTHHAPSLPRHDESVVPESHVDLGRLSRSGAVAGAIAATVFTWVHEIVISNIWNTLPIMLVAGVVSGACIGWTYAELVAKPSQASWVGYTLGLQAIFVLLGLVSLVVFEPVTTAAEVISQGGSPSHLFGQAMPLMVGFVVIGAAVLALAAGWTVRRFGSSLATMATLMIFLGSNVAILGLVSIPASSFSLVAELFALTFMLGTSFMVGVLILERREMPGRAVSSQPHPA